MLNRLIYWGHRTDLA